jgi:hypothetical protein
MSPSWSTINSTKETNPMTTSQALNLLDELTYSEIREQLDLAGIDGISELDNQQVYSLALDCLTDQ